jgi:hypothetical protein
MTDVELTDKEYASYLALLDANEVRREHARMTVAAYEAELENAAMQAQYERILHARSVFDQTAKTTRDWINYQAAKLVAYEEYDTAMDDVRQEIACLVRDLAKECDAQESDPR